MSFINFLHTFNPSPILISIGLIHIYWYGFFIVLGVLSALTVAIYLAKFYNIKTDVIIDLALWLTVGGLIGARIYDVFLEWPYFSTHPLDIFKIWQGGLAIHGAIIGGVIALWLFVKRSAWCGNFWQLAAIVITGLPLAQAIGRWGNFFNQELFGRPADLAWGIPIDAAHRPLEYLGSEYFHPAFLYESIGNLFIFIILMLCQVWLIKKSRAHELRVATYEFCVLSYAILYSLLRFSMEFIRIDPTPIVLGWRFPQIISLIVIIGCLAYLGWKYGRNDKQNPALEK